LQFLIRLIVERKSWGHFNDKSPRHEEVKLIYSLEKTRNIMILPGAKEKIRVFLKAKLVRDKRKKETKGTW